MSDEIPPISKNMANNIIYFHFVLLHKFHVKSVPCEIESYGKA